MRIGGAIMKMYNSPSQWLSYVKELTYSSVSFPVNSDAPKSVIHDYLSCIRDNDLVIGEVGIWKNCFSSDEDVRKNAYDWSVRQLALAEEVGANCCVNISGAFGSVWDGYYCENLTEKAYEKVVSLAQRIIDEVKPVKTSFTLEPMPWMYPDSPETYLKLIKDIDR
ncbi:MAG: sugar phosphate isomerase/epimerase, partial [Clostridia bacterium]|nr:sugar phosphate isomerase/epimerase [Clostridia bacterium]